MQTLAGPGFSMAMWVQEMEEGSWTVTGRVADIEVCFSLMSLVTPSVCVETQDWGNLGLHLEPKPPIFLSTVGKHCD